MILKEWMVRNLSYALGFTIEDVYQGYIKKNAENYKRIERGY